MNEHLSSFLKQKRKEHLIRLNLVDNSKSERKKIYSNKPQFGYTYDETSKQYVREVVVPSPIDISNDDYNNLVLCMAMQHFFNNSQGKTKHAYKTPFANAILYTSILLLIINVFAFFVSLFGSGFWWQYDLGILSISTTFTYIISFPFILGLYKIVAAAERYLQS